MDRYDNTAQYALVPGHRPDLPRLHGRPGHAPPTPTRLFDAAEKTFAQPDWEKQVFTKTKLEKIFLTNEFDDPLEGFDTDTLRPLPADRHLVFQLDKPGPRQRLAKATGVEVGDAATLRKALAEAVRALHPKGAKACAISLPPDFHPAPFDDEHFYEQMQFHGFQDLAPGVFWMLAEFCREFRLPFDLMIGVNRRVYARASTRGRTCSTSGTSLIQYRSCSTPSRR